MVLLFSSMIDSLYLYLGVYLLLLFIIPFIISRRQRREDFLIASRNRSGWQVLASKFASGIGAGYFITYTGFAYEFGFGVFAILAGLVIGYMLFAFWAVPKIRDSSISGKFYTLGHFVFAKTKNRFSMVLADIVSVLVLLAWLIVGMIGGGKIISYFGLMDYNTAVLLSAFVVLVYLLMAGYKAVVITDILQSFIILALLFLVTLAIVGNENLTMLFNAEVGPLDMGILLGFLLFGSFSSLSRIDFFQLAYASKNKKEAIRGFSLAIIPIITVCFFLLLIGLFMFTRVSGLNTDLVFVEALKLFLPASLLPLAIVLFFSGIMSSADTNVYGVSSHIAMYFKKGKTLLIRIITFLLLVFVALFAILFPDVVDISIIAGGLNLILPIPMIYLLFNGKKEKKFISGVISGFIGMIIGMIFMGLTPAIALPTFLFAGIGLFYPQTKKIN